ncbi:MAG: IgGFc-binding protein [Deltaproteobacteria bacterium]|nr:IgGFc-binding protein [Deltaproteobacteria bacterium]
MHAASRLIILLPLLAAACAPGDDGGQTDVRRDDARTDSDAGPDTPGDDAGDADVPFACIPGEWNCFGTVRYQCGDDGYSRINETACDHECDPALGCVLCDPNTRRCEGTVSMFCSPDGAQWITGRDCSEWGSVCIATGYCADACGEAESTHSYVGCEYWPTPLANTAELNPTLFDFRVVVANPNAATANIRVTRGATEVYTGTVEPGRLSEIPLPWIDGQSFGIPGSSWTSIAKTDGAYRLRSDLPVTVSQFNPFEYSVTDPTLGPTFSYTNDATLLLPSHVLTGDYVGLTYVPFSRATGTTGTFPTPPTFMSYPDYIAVVGIAPEPTDVEIEVTGFTAREATGRFDDTDPWGTIRFTLQRGEVVHVAAGGVPECRDDRPGWSREEDCTFGICDYLDTCFEFEHDLTGSRIRANHPVQVFGGHVCAYVPYTSQACDHLEVQLAPIQTWGKEYVSRPMTDNGGPGENLVRVVAAFDGTHISVDPPQGDIGEVDLAAYEWVEFMAWEPFHVTASQAVQVGQFLVGQYYPDPDAARGDPAMTVLVPNEQFRSDYIFTAPASYNAGTNGQSWVLVIRPPGMALTLDGSAVSVSWDPVGGREVGIVPIAGGTHTISGAEPFGMITYGLGSFTSYAYPAGLNLEPITILI